jgi:hypothetical protein
MYFAATFKSPWYFKSIFVLIGPLLLLRRRRRCRRRRRRRRA